MSKDYELVVMQPNRTGKGFHKSKLVAKIIVQQQDDFTNTDVAKMLFAIELAANSHSELPIRVHINEVAQ